MVLHNSGCLFSPKTFSRLWGIYEELQSKYVCHFTENANPGIHQY